MMTWRALFRTDGESVDEMPYQMVNEIRNKGMFGLEDWTEYQQQQVAQQNTTQQNTVQQNVPNNTQPAPAQQSATSSTPNTGEYAGMSDQAVIALGEKYQSNREYKKAADCFESLARKGNKEGQYRLGVVEWLSANALAQGGSTTEANKAYVKALTWLKPAADGGHAESQFYVGEAYTYGRGVTADKATAKEYYRKAASQGHAQAQQRADRL
jgi:TPR repeat protein